MEEIVKFPPFPCLQMPILNSTVSPSTHSSILIEFAVGSQTPYLMDKASWFAQYVSQTHTALIPTEIYCVSIPSPWKNLTWTKSNEKHMS